MKKFNPIPWTFSDIINALNLREELDVYPGVKTGENCRPVFSGVSTDSRSIKDDELFLAVKGENFDGHDFIEKLADRGIKGFIAQAEFFDNFVEFIENNRLAEKKRSAEENRSAGKNKDDRSCKNHDEKQNKKSVFKEGITLFKVDDTLKALGMLAKFQRIRSKVKLVAITGSNGKTSTRQMTSEIFKTRFNTLTTTGNFNNEIGVPLTLLKLSYEHQWAIVEMGMNHKGELSWLSEMATPDIAVVTNTAKAHLEGLGTVLEVATAKAEIFDFVAKGGTAIINHDDKRWKIIEEKAKKNSGIEKIILTGTSENSVIRAESIKHISQKTCFTLAADNPYSKVNICMNTPAAYMVINALAAAAAAFTAGLSGNEIKKGLESFTPVSGRMTIKESSKGFFIIDDTYNANPDSVKGALETLAELSREQISFVVLGDMLELGEKSAELHFKTGRQAALSGVSRLYVYGDMAEHIASGAVEAGLEANRIMKGGKKEIVDSILGRRDQPAWILVKGSRGMKMEDVVAGLI